LLDDLQSVIEEAMGEWQVPGVAVAVVREDEPILVRAFGQRDVEAGLPVTTDTQFILCSITKTFTAVGLGMLVDERRLDWLKPVREYIPEFRLHDAIATDRVTVRDLLCHHSGLPRHDWVSFAGGWSREKILAALRYLEPSRDVRATFQYSNLAYMVAGMVAERITGQSWEDFTRNRIMKPLSMKSSGFSPEELERAEDSAWPYVMADDERRRAKLWPIRAAPSGGINASISSMVNYLRFLLGEGRFDGAQLLSPQTFRVLQAPRVHAGRAEFKELEDYHYGLGFGSHRYRGDRVVGHGGLWIGWSTLMALLPERRVGVIVLTNHSPNPISNIVAFAVFDHLCGREPIPWLDRFRSRKRQFVAHRAANRQAHQASRKSTAGPTRPLAEYVGVYEHPGYGRIEIEQVGSALQWRFRSISGTLTHRHYDVFEVPEDPMAFSPDLLAITFLYDREGDINRLSAPFEPLVADIVFTRVPSGDATDPAFRLACKGTYGGGGPTHIVAVDADGQLTLSPADQPTYHLVPYQGRVFRILELDAFRVEFRRNEAGVVDTIVFHQPNGTFLAERIA
jgi:CubicO group peptidase (beta-lactamase class C family)